MDAAEKGKREQKLRSLFDLPPDFFESCRLLLFHHPSGILKEEPSPSPQPSLDGAVATAEDIALGEDSHSKVTEEKVKGAATQRWTCNTCKSEFESLLDQRFHFKSDLHRLNIKLSVSGKNIVKEEDFDEHGRDSTFEDFDVSSISGSEDEIEKAPVSIKQREGVKSKLHIRLNSGERVSVWRSLILDESEDVSLDEYEVKQAREYGSALFIGKDELTRRLTYLLSEPRDRTHLRIVLLLTGGHFAGCIFDGNSVIAHKTFHRYVVRAKAGKMQSTKDATGKSAHSAGSSLRRHNEAALKKEIQDLLVTWKQYISSSVCIFIYAPSRNRQIFFDGENQHTIFHDRLTRHIPLTVRRPTLKEAKRIYLCLTQLSYELDEKSCLLEGPKLHTVEVKINQLHQESHLNEHLEVQASAPLLRSAMEHLPSENRSTPLHAAAQSGNAQWTLELLEQGCSPCLKDERGRTPYMLATEKEVRNTFRRFMAENLDRWDWQAAHVPSPLTKEVEESQAVKQAEKDAKRKAKAKELKKLRKAKEKAKAKETAPADVSAAAPQSHTSLRIPPSKQLPRSNAANGVVAISKEEEEKQAIAEEREKRAAAAEEREKRAAAAERRIAAMKNKGVAAVATASGSADAAAVASDLLCSCCNASLVGKVPFHRYHYNYCSTSCMHIHRKILEDG